jgi:hypothetical protein
VRFDLGFLKGKRENERWEINYFLRVKFAKNYVFYVPMWFKICLVVYGLTFKIEKNN